MKALLAFEYLHLTLLTSKHFWSSTAKRRCSILHNSWSRRGFVLKLKKSHWKKTHTAPHSSSGVIHVSKSHAITNWFEDTLLVWSSWWTCFLLCRHSEGFILKKKKNINNIFSNQFEISGLPGTWSTPDEWCMYPPYVLFCYCFFNVLKQVPICFSCLGGCCSAALLWMSRHILWTTKLHLPFLQHGGDYNDQL